MAPGKEMYSSKRVGTYGKEDLPEKDKGTYLYMCLLLLQTFINWKDTRRKTIASLEVITTGLEKTKNDINITEVAAASVGIVGSGLTIAGLILTPLTGKYSAVLKALHVQKVLCHVCWPSAQIVFAAHEEALYLFSQYILYQKLIVISVGLSSPLLIAGLAVSIPSAVTGIGAAIADLVIDKTKGEEAIKCIEADLKATEELRKIAEKLEKELDMNLNQVGSSSNDFSGLTMGVLGL